jgi:hypothetical protein
MKDALDKDLVIGQTYGYSRSENGITTVKIGKLVKINEKMVSLEVQESKWGVYTNDLEEKRFTNKIISVKANGLFPVNEFNLGDCVTTEYYYHGERFRVVGIRENELELRGDWSGGTHSVDQTGWYPKEKCKKVEE